MQCPCCSKTNIVKNGSTHYGKQRFRCQACGRQFVDTPTRTPTSQATRELVDKLLLERLSLAAIVRVTGLSERWLQYYANAAVKVPKNSCNRYFLSIVSAPFVTLTLGRLMHKCCQASDRSAVGKESGKTSYLERFNNTLRKRVGRLVRKTLSFS